MSKYIDSELLIAHLEAEASECNSYGDASGLFAEAYERVIDYLRALPAADVAPVRHGRWAYWPEDGVYTCSECGNAELETGCGKFCGYCGAKMDGGENHETN